MAGRFSAEVVGVYFPLLSVHLLKDHHDWVAEVYAQRLPLCAGQVTRVLLRKSNLHAIPSSRVRAYTLQPKKWYTLAYLGFNSLSTNMMVFYGISTPRMLRPRRLV